MIWGATDFPERVKNVHTALEARPVLLVILQLIKAANCHYPFLSL